MAWPRPTCHRRAVSARAAVTFELRPAPGRLLVDARNPSGAPITIVAHPRYLTLELLDGRGQFVRGRMTDATMPSKADFADVPARGTAAGVLSWPIAREDGATSVGPWTFDRVPDQTECRLTYKSDPAVPNLPSNKRQTFFRGPIESARTPLTLTP